MIKNNSKKRQKKSSPAGCLFWIAVILLFIIIFFLNHKNIEEVITSTGFFEVFDRNETEKSVKIERITGTGTKPEETANEIVIIPVDKTVDITVNKTILDTTDKIEEKTAKPIIQEPEYNFRDTKLYFIQVNSEGNISLINLKRKVKYTDSPLTATLSALLAGLTTSELNSGLISLIPDSSVIKGIRISDGTAFINFNENFLFNPFGREGYIGQLKQVIYTATEYSTVKRVQFLIDGESKKYLGSEAIFIGNPLTRNSF
jgi:spore germination protein GerM